MSIQDFSILRLTTVGPEVTNVVYKHIRCDVCGIRPIARVGETSVKFTRKSDMMDFSRTQGGLLVRQSIVGCLTEAKVSGWRSGDVQVEKIERLREVDSSYRELIVIGQAKNYTKYVDLEIFSSCSICGRTSYVRPDPGQLIIPAECWDGSDIFRIPELPGIYVASNLFRSTIEVHKGTGIKFLAPEDWYNPI